MMDEPISSPRSEVPVERVAGTSRRLLLGTVVVAMLIVVAMLKPWAPSPSSGKVGGPLGQTVNAPALAPAPSDGAQELAERLRACPAPGKWGILATASSGGWLVETMLPVVPAAADGPLAGVIPTRRVWGDTLLGFGLCLPTHDAPTIAAQAASVRIWLVDDVSGAARPIIGAPPLSAGETRLGAIDYGPPADLPGAAVSPNPPTYGAATWPPGRYVFAVEERGVPGGNDEDLAWFALEYIRTGATAIARP